MKTETTQASADLAHGAKLIDDIPIAMLATVEADDTLASRAMAVLEMDASGARWFFTDRGRIEGLWTAFAGPWFPDGPDSPNLALLKFNPDAADCRDAPNTKMVRSFGVIASMIAGKPIAMGEHGSHTGLSSSASAVRVRS